MNDRDAESGSNLPARPAIVGEGMLRVSILAEVPPLLRELGHDPSKVLEELRLGPELLDDPERTIPFHTAGALLERCVALSGCRHFGLLVGQRGGLHTVGVVGLLARHSPDVGAALRNLVKYLHLHDRGASPSLSVRRQSAVLGYAIFGKDVPAPDQICAGSMAVVCKIMRDLCGAGWNPSEVLLPFRAPGDTAPFKTFFRAPLRFGADMAALSFPATWLEHPLSGADPEVLQAIGALLADLSAAGAADTAGPVRRAVLGLLMTGSVTEDEVAGAFAMHRRTLGRRLQREGTSFQKILKEVRFEVACHLLRDTDRAIGDIASVLGYAGGSPFGRAFRELSGITPAEWRSRHAARSGGR